jgi:hypothetical protein
MKSIFLILFTSCATWSGSSAQGLASWFSQQATELEYYADQIAAYEVCAGYLEKGYRIADEGLTAISQFKRGEFSLHQAFFESLENINPAIAGYAKEADIMRYQLAIIHCLSGLFQAGNSSPSETFYFQRIYRNMVRDCVESMGTLADVLTNRAWQMSDDERLKRVDRIRSDLRDRLAFSQHFVTLARQLSAQRGRNQNELEFLKTLY